MCQLSLGQVMADILNETPPILDWHSTDTQLTLNQLSADMSAMNQLSVDQYSPDILTKCQLKYRSRVSANTTYCTVNMSQDICISTATDICSVEADGINFKFQI